VSAGLLFHIYSQNTDFTNRCGEGRWKLDVFSWFARKFDFIQKL